MNTGKLIYLNMEEAYNNFESKFSAASDMIIVERSKYLPGMIVILICVKSKKRIHKGCKKGLGGDYALEIRRSRTE